MVSFYYMYIFMFKYMFMCAHSKGHTGGYMMFIIVFHLNVCLKGTRLLMCVCLGAMGWNGTGAECWNIRVV